MIGIIGYGFVGREVARAFTCDNIICDPKYNDITLDQVIDMKPEAVFVCLPTPMSDSAQASMESVIDVVTQIKQADYDGIIIVKSTVLPGVFDEDIVCNPEFLSRSTATVDFQQPQLLVFGGDRAREAHELYRHHSSVICQRPVIITDNNTACMIKYTMNCFYATKLCYMNIMYDAAEQCGADYDIISKACREHPWMGSHHFDVPGPDRKRGFGGPCLPKDLKTFAMQFDAGLLEHVFNQNLEHRKS